MTIHRFPTIASKFAEQHQVDPDEAYRDAVYDEIRAKVQQLVTAFGIAIAALTTLYFIAEFLR